MENLYNKIENTINSIDGMQKAEAPPFFHTRVHAKLESRLGQQQDAPLPMRKPVWVIATLTLLLAANIFLLTTHTNKQSSTGNNTSDASTLQGFANAYGLNSSTGY